MEVINEQQENGNMYEDISEYSSDSEYIDNRQNFGMQNRNYIQDEEEEKLEDFEDEDEEDDEELNGFDLPMPMPTLGGFVR